MRQILQKNHILTKRFLSYQTKQGLYYAIEEAKKNKSDVVTLKFLFYGILKANPSLLNLIISTLYSNNLFLNNESKTLIYRCELSFKNQNKRDNLSSSKAIVLSKPVRNLFYSLLRNTKSLPSSKYHKKDFIVITTFSIFLGLLKNKSIKNWLKDEVFLLKK